MRFLLLLLGLGSTVSAQLLASPEYCMFFEHPQHANTTSTTPRCALLSPTFICVLIFRLVSFLCRIQKNVDCYIISTWLACRSRLQSTSRVDICQLPAPPAPLPMQCTPSKPLAMCGARSICGHFFASSFIFILKALPPPLFRLSIPRCSKTLLPRWLHHVQPVPLRHVVACCLLPVCSWAGVGWR